MKIRRMKGATHFNVFCVLFIEGSNVESIGSVDFTSRGDERWGVLAVIHQLPVDFFEKLVFSNFQGSAIKQKLKRVNS